MNLLPRNRCQHDKGECFSCYLWDTCERKDKERPNTIVGAAIAIVCIGILVVVLVLIFG